jgi:hypothetical protein
MSMVAIRAALETQLGTVPPILPATAFTVVAGNPAVFTTATPHGLVTGMQCTLPNYTGGTPALTGKFIAIVLSSTTFNLQNSATKAPIAVTIAGSSGSILADLTAYQNTSYQAVQGVPYQLIHMTTFKPDEPTQGEGYYQEHGVFQVTLVYPVGIGVGAITARAELIRSSFKRGTFLTNAGVKVTVPFTPEFGYLQGGSDSIELPVKIEYRADIYT